MITEKAQVVAVEGEYALVQAQRRAACDSCEVKKGCGTSVLAKVVGQRFARLKVLNSVQAEVGDQVLVGVAEQGLLTGAVLIYLFPLLAAALAGLAGQWLFGEQYTEGWAIVLASLGLFFGLVGVKWRLGRANRRTDLMPVILAIQPSSQDSHQGVLLA